MIGGVKGKSGWVGVVKGKISSIPRSVATSVIMRECGEGHLVKGLGRDYSTFTIALYFSSSRGLMEFIQLGEPLVETNKKFFRFNFYNFTLLFSVNCAKKSLSRHGQKQCSAAAAAAKAVLSSSSWR